MPIYINPDSEVKSVKSMESVAFLKKATDSADFTDWLGLAGAELRIGRHE